MNSPLPVSTRLRRWHRRQWIGTLSLFLLRLTAFGIPLLCLYGLADLGLALPPASRQLWNLLLPAVLIAFAASDLQSPGALAALARRLDRFNRDRRRSISCALDLEAGTDQTDLQSQLRASALREGQERLDSLPAGAVIPFRTLGRLGLLAGIGGACLTALLLQFPDISSTVAARIRHPSRDIAPWTPLRFELLPETPSVVYGEDLDLTLEVIGGRPSRPVMLKTRVAGDQREAPAFREADNRFSQRLEQVTQPLEFCFTIGRIRSPWKSVEVQLLPRVSTTAVQLIPPAYTGKSETRHAFGERVLEGFEGTDIHLAVESNRPLSMGELVIRREGEEPRRVPATLSGNRARFHWTLEQSASLSIQLRDIQGNAMERPLTSHQRLIPDREPEVTLTHPPRFMLATPSIQVPVKGIASDDVGITRFSLIRGTPGFIDRPKLLEEGPPERNRAVNQTLDLAALGVEPGDILELYLEAMDHRPRERGRTGVSGLSRIQIISEEEFAEQVRAAELLDGFRDRFQTAVTAITDVEEALEHLRKEIESPEATRESLRAALDRAAVANRTAEEVFAAMSSDFPVYELESEARDMLEEFTGHFASQGDELEKLDVDDMALDLKVQSLIGTWRERTEALEPTLAEQERFLTLGELLKQTADYRELLRRQELLVRWYERYAYALPAEAAEALRELGDYQQALREDVTEWIEDTRTRAEALHPEDQRWREEALEVIGMLEASDVDGLMRDTAAAARNEANREALRLARAVLEAMRLPNEDPKSGEESAGQNTFKGMCRGTGGGDIPCEGGGPGLSSSLQQLMDALRNRGRGQGSGGGSGGGGGGVGGYSDDGYATRGSSALQLPMLGPNRNRFDLPYGQAVDGYSTGRGAGAGGGGSGPSVSGGDSGSHSGAGAAPTELRLERSPPRYREAIRAFFDITRENP